MMPSISPSNKVLTSPTLFLSQIAADSFVNFSARVPSLIALHVFCGLNPSVSFLSCWNLSFPIESSPYSVSFGLSHHLYLVLSVFLASWWFLTATSVFFFGISMEHIGTSNDSARDMILESKPTMVKDHEPKIMNYQALTYHKIPAKEEIHENLNHIPVCLLGKIITDKPIHKGLMQAALSNICCNPKNLLVKEVESVIFQITMDSVEDHRCILK
ncbi:hypothetical protein KIW84_020699 [Lathyrus oleraceus]|uniref:Uncharacterized protein n=1 Tax=Pisum sativum TaxID=3888 RepID=A0A9D4Y9T7_PEA|nr:hypothetical protein KIW84_020699 [Pisum sativum]